MISRLAMVALGGALGAVTRYGVSGWVARTTGQSPFPYGTLAVNVAGAFLLGALMGATASGTFLLAPRLPALLGIGFLGALTTFSTLTYETVEALRVGDVWVAASNVAVSVVVGRAAAESWSRICAAPFVLRARPRDAKSAGMLPGKVFALHQRCL